jgi:tRNA U55 pseudouridine synthase TruB
MISRIIMYFIDFISSPGINNKCIPDLIILVGEECKGKDRFLPMKKEYEVEFLLGVETDTYDLLGIFQKESEVSEITIEKGKFTQPYPPFSSKTFSGGKAETKEVEIYDHKILEKRTISKEELHTQIKTRIALVKGEFRQKEILAAWEAYFAQTKKTEYRLIKVWIFASSGTYMRSIAHRNQSLAYSIKRTTIRG